MKKKIFWNFCPKKVFLWCLIIAPPPRENKQFLIQGGGAIIRQIWVAFFFSWFFEFWRSSWSLPWWYCCCYFWYYFWSDTKLYKFLFSALKHLCFLHPSRRQKTAEKPKCTDTFSNLKSIRTQKVLLLFWHPYFFLRKLSSGTS